MKETAALRKQLSSGINSAAAKEGARWALERASSSTDPAELADIVRALAECIAGKRNGRGRPPKAKIEDGAVLPDQKSREAVNVRTAENVALSIYAHLVNARDIIDGRPRTYPGYNDDDNETKATARLDEFCLLDTPKRAIKHAASEAAKLWIEEETGHTIKIDRFIELKSKLR